MMHVGIPDTRNAFYVPNTVEAYRQMLNYAIPARVADNMCGNLFFIQARTGNAVMPTQHSADLHDADTYWVPLTAVVLMHG